MLLRRVFELTSHKSLEDVLRGYMEERHTTLQLPFSHLNLLEETGEKLLSHWTCLKIEVLEHPSPKSGQSWYLQRRGD